MSLSVYQKMIVKSVIVMSFVFYVFCTSAIAGCGFNLLPLSCYTGEIGKGEYCDFNDCTQSPPYDLTDKSYKVNVINPYSTSGCYDFVYQYEWQPDPDDSCCNSPDPCCGKGPDCCPKNGETRACATKDGCPGKQICKNNTWSECISKDCCPAGPGL